MRQMTAARSSLLLGACLVLFFFASTVASAVPQRRFYAGPYSANGYAGYPNCSVATFSALQSVDFQRQYNADGFLYRLIEIENWRSCRIAMLPHLNSQDPQSLERLTSDNTDILFYGRDGTALCNGPYNETMMLGFVDDDGTTIVVSNWSTIVDQIQPCGPGSFRYWGSVAILDCATPPAPQKPAEKRFFIGAYSGRGYLPEYPNCTVATLQAFQSSAFLQQYNQYGSLSQLGLIDPSLDCGIDVAPYPGAEPGRLSYSGYIVAPYAAKSRQPQCNGPYNTAMKIGAHDLFDVITPELQENVSVSSFVYTGSVALYDCAVPAVVKSPPAQRFRLAAYDSSGYASIDPNCSVATLVAFQSSAFREQYNYYSALPWFGPPASGLSCEPVVIPYAGGEALIGSLSYQGGSIAPFGLDGALLCNGWYNATMRIGSRSDDNGDNQMFDSIWPSMQNAASVGSFDYTGSLALIDCASPAAPTPVPVQRFWLGAYTSNATTTLGGRTCQVATLEAFQSPAFRHQYNYYHALGVLGALPDALDCRIVITSSTKPFTAATISFDYYGHVDTFGRDGNKICNGPYNSTMKIGCGDTDGNGKSAVFDSLRQSMQDRSGLGQFYTNVSIALYDCGGADGSG